MALLTAGNGKLGAAIAHFDLPAGPAASCPGASSFCAALCYAQKGRYTFANVQGKYANNWAQAQDLPALAANLAAELAKLQPGAIVRLHTSGDFFSAAYVDMWRTLAANFPSVRFYAYTRSWRIAEMVPALEALAALPNFRLWASTDPTTGPAPAGWRTAEIFRTFADAPADYIRCPEQLGTKPNCGSCGICFADKLRPSVKLAFKLH